MNHFLHEALSQALKDVPQTQLSTIILRSHSLKTKEAASFSGSLSVDSDKEFICC
jgi:hypothetical protein